MWLNATMQHLFTHNQGQPYYSHGYLFHASFVTKTADSEPKEFLTSTLNATVHPHLEAIQAWDPTHFQVTEKATQEHGEAPELMAQASQYPSNHG